MADESKKLAVREDTHLRLKIYAAQQDERMVDLATEAIENYLDDKGGGDNEQ